MGYVQWQRLLVQYYTKPNGKREVHERLVIRSLANDWYHICTPDGDVYMEQITKPPLMEIWELTEFLDGSRAVPDDLEGEETYFFEEGSAGLSPLEDGHKEMLLKESEGLFYEDMSQLGFHLQRPADGRVGKGFGLGRDASLVPKLTIGGGPDTTGTPVGGLQGAEEVPPDAGPSGWPKANLDAGTVGSPDTTVDLSLVVGISNPEDEFPAKPDAVVGGPVGVLTSAEGEFVQAVRDAQLVLREAGTGSMSSAKRAGISTKPMKPLQELPSPDAPCDDQDLRLMPHTSDDLGRRFFEFDKASDTFKLPDVEDFRVAGPHTLRFVADFCSRRGGDWSGFHSHCKHNGGLLDDDPGMLEHESLCRVLDAATKYDHLQVSQGVNKEHAELTLLKEDIMLAAERAHASGAQKPPKESRLLHARCGQSAKGCISFCRHVPVA